MRQETGRCGAVPHGLVLTFCAPTAHNVTREHSDWIRFAANGSLRHHVLRCVSCNFHEGLAISYATYASRTPRAGCSYSPSDQLSLGSRSISWKMKMYFSRVLLMMDGATLSSCAWLIRLRDSSASSRPSSSTSKANFATSPPDAARSMSLLAELLPRAGLKEYDLANPVPLGGEADAPDDVLSQVHRFRLVAMGGAWCAALPRLGREEPRPRVAVGARLQADAG